MVAAATSSPYVIDLAEESDEKSDEEIGGTIYDDTMKSIDELLVLARSNFDKKKFKIIPQILKINCDLAGLEEKVRGMRLSTKKTVQGMMIYLGLAGECLAPGRYVDDDIINYCLQMASSHHEEILCVPCSIAVVARVQETNEVVRNISGQFQRNKDKKKVKLVFIPMKSQWRDHWNLVIVSTQNKRLSVHFYEPSGGGTESLQKDFNENIWPGLSEIYPEKRSRLYAKSFYQLPNQDNSTDCGLYVIAAVLAISNGMNLEENDLDEEVCLYMRLCIFNHIVTILS